MSRTPEFPCSSCDKNVNNNHKALQCDICNQWIHLRCNYLDLTEYNRLKKCSLDWFCTNCLKEILPFQKLTTNELIPLTTKGITLTEAQASHHISPQLQTHLNNLSKFLNDNSSNNTEDAEDNGNHDNDLVNPINCKYYDYDEFGAAKFSSSKSFSILHYNIHSIQKHIESLRTLLLMLESDKFEFDIIAISESKILKNNAPQVDIKIQNYHNPISIPTEANKGGVLLYVNKRHQNFKPRNDLNVYAPKKLESAFIEIINNKTKNDIIGVIYRHPSMELDTFNEEHLRPFMQKISLEKNKNTCIAGDFNVNLLNVSSHEQSSEFIDILTSEYFSPTITLPTKLNSSGNDTLIDNIYSNIFNPDIISGNITFNVSDGHLPSFTIFPKSNQNHLPKKHNIYKHNTTKFNPNHPDFQVSKFEMSQEIQPLDWGKNH